MTKIPARVISANRITIPEEFRDCYDAEGDWVMVEVEPMTGDSDDSERLIG